MTNGHVLDEQIQEILDDPSSGAARSHNPHLQICTFCQERFEQYRQLYAGLAADPGFILPPAFADSILNKMPAAGPAFLMRPLTQAFLAAGAFIMVLVATFMFVDMKPLTADVSRIFNSTVAAFRPLPAQFQQLLGKLGDHAGLFVLGGFSLLGAAFFDQILQGQILRRSR